MKKITFGSAYKIVEKIIPSRTLSSLKKTSAYKAMGHLAKKCLPSDHKPSWQAISAGPLKGFELYVDPSGEWQREMLAGDYDNFFFKYLEPINLSGKTIFDVGAHLGFHTLHFAQKVGPTGSIIAFEPNQANIDRLSMIIKRNGERTKQVKIMQKAVSDQKGTLTFMCTDGVDDGSSCGGFIDGSDTFFKKESYSEERGFKPTTVETISIDDLVTSGTINKPDLIKIDIEGAEHLAIDGAIETLKKYSPILLIEIHSKFNDTKITNILHDLGYKIDILKKETGDRCFIAATRNI